MQVGILSLRYVCNRIENISDCLNMLSLFIYFCFVLDNFGNLMNLAILLINDALDPRKCKKEVSSFARTIDLVELDQETKSHKIRYKMNKKCNA